MTIKKPMLAETAETLADIPLPCLASFKLDGIRCIKVDGKALSRSFKPIPNHFVRNWIEQNLPDGIDGEIMVPGMDFNSIQSAIMGREGEPDFRFHAFDLAADDLALQFEYRIKNLQRYFENAPEPVKVRLLVVEQELCRHQEHLVAFEKVAFEKGYEGIMTRRWDSPYKCGRSTLKEAFLLKYKRWVDSEAVILGFVEQLTNTNEKETDALGHSKRSSKKEGKVPANTLGAFQVRDLVTGQSFEIGTGEGLTKALRQEIWDNRTANHGKLVRYKHQVSPNDPKDMLPRFPSFQGFRHEDDMS